MWDAEKKIRVYEAHIMYILFLGAVNGRYVIRVHHTADSRIHSVMTTPILIFSSPYFDKYSQILLVASG